MRKYVAALTLALGLSGLASFSAHADCPEGAGVYDASNSCVGYNPRGDIQLTEAYFATEDDMNHWLQTYSNVNVQYAGPAGGGQPYYQVNFWWN